MRTYNYLLSALFLCFIGCDNNSSEKEISQTYLPEVNPVEIKLSGIASQRFVEASGLAWFNDWLVILPQYPYKISDEKSGALLAVPKSRLMEYIDGINISTVNCELVPFSAPDFESLLQSSGSGLEAVAFNGDDIYLAVESYSEFETKSVLLKGKVYGDLDSVVVDPEYHAVIESASGIENFSEETILFFNNSIYAIHESNGQSIVVSPKANVYDTELHYIGNVSFPNIEYRITDATCVDEHGTFYVMNYFYSGDTHIKPYLDQLITRWGIGETNETYNGIERILECQFTETGIILTERPPIYIFLSNNTGRNWEGIAKLDSLGFLVVTDYYPGTILSFIPLLE